ncbi:phosphate ABC transporter substrate-binding protein [Alcanivorax balearicus MACL04]|uniref:Phosphate ABC transporter substrate-binding protein n=1 Tax=Alloalcanivorax balearicus MACL04 TaxID=1177182 RepID=A0ABT2QTT7_9GAMM|nr:substrate-binding domain-containing protein [Alloalcanivorax balearicus]MCU5780910.1 phosphate ABC transporter substrate-binding protein [Alloalcanivorax balearicus MACL04]
MKASIVGAAAALALATAPATAIARDTISIVGSSTVYPFATVVAERFGRASGQPTPKIESTGSGGGMKIFCQGVGENTPDITNASRRMKTSEFELCQKNGVKDITEVQIGYDGLALANSVKGQDMDITLRDLYLALAKDVPDPKGGEKLVPNPYKTWKDVNPALPNIKIEVIGPPPTSGTRDSFNELGVEGGCKTFDWLKAMKGQDKDKYKAVCRSIREDGAYIEAGENDNLIIQKLESTPDALGAFGYSFLDQNRGGVKAVKINGVEPDMNTISSGDYPMSRSMFFYVKKAHVGVVPGIEGYIKEFTSERAWGEEGYLVDKGLIPSHKDERKKWAKNAAALNSMTGKEL